MVFFSQRAPIERVVGVACGLGDQHDVFVMAHPMFEGGCSLHWDELALSWKRIAQAAVEIHHATCLLGTLGLTVNQMHRPWHHLDPLPRLEDILA